MRITVDYKKRQYGTGDAVRQYRVTLSDTTDLFIANRENPTAEFYESRELKISFRGKTTAAGRGWDWSDLSIGEVQGGTIELSHDAARQLANAILQYLERRQEQGHATQVEVEVNERPEPKGKAT